MNTCSYGGVMGVEKEHYRGRSRIGVYPGQYYDEESGMHYNFHRYYEPGSGRYINEDPIRFDGGANLFLYVNNKPIILLDPQGLYDEEVHLFYTYSLASDMGFSWCAAWDVAKANNDVDDIYNPEDVTLEGYRDRKNWHFTKKERVAELLDKSLASCDLKDLGQALHVLQDYFSHYGYGPKTGHPPIIGVDDPRKHPEKTKRMLGETNYYLKQFKSKCNKEAEKCCAE